MCVCVVCASVCLIAFFRTAAADLVLPVGCLRGKIVLVKYTLEDVDDANLVLDEECPSSTAPE